MPTIRKRLKPKTKQPFVGTSDQIDRAVSEFKLPISGERCSPLCPQAPKVLQRHRLNHLCLSNPRLRMLLLQKQPNAATWTRRSRSSCPLVLTEASV